MDSSLADYIELSLQLQFNKPHARLNQCLVCVLRLSLPHVRQLR